MSYSLKYGSFIFPDGFSPMSQDTARDLAEQERPRAAGSITQAARPQSRRLTVEGSAMGFGGGPTAIQAAIDALRGACEGSGGVAPLLFGRSDRYINAQVASLSESYGSGASLFGAVHKLLISFVAGDPYFYAAISTTATGLTSGGGTVTPGGNASAFATWTVSISAGGTGQIVLANTTTGQAALLGTTGTAWVTGDVVVLTRSGTAYTVTKNGAAAPGLMAGLIPMLAVGGNVITLAAPSGVSLAALQCTYTARWQS